MNLRILHSEFELNLIDASFTMVEENNWFRDQWVTKYTYPVAMKLSDEDDAALGFISENYSNKITTVYGVDFYVLGERYEAKIEIERCEGREVQFQVQYGLEEFPNFNKKLTQLPLHKFELDGENMYEHSEANIDVSYPELDYCFPKVFTEKVDTSTEIWEFFQGAINNYQGGAMLVNEYDVDNDIQINRNVIQPMPFFLYVLKKGLEDAGYTLEGDILTDPHFSKAALFTYSSLYVESFELNKQEILLKTDDPDRVIIDYDNAGNPYFASYAKEIVLDEPGRYLFSGIIYLRAAYPFVASAWFKRDNVTIESWEHTSGNIFENSVVVNFYVDVFEGDEPVTIDFGSNNTVFGNWTDPDYSAPILDITVTMVVSYDTAGGQVPNFIQNTIDLTKCVPDITFGEMLTAAALWKNYDIDVTGTVVTINKINKQLGKGKKVSLKEYEVKYPERNFGQGKSFVLKFQDVSSENYEYKSVYVDINGYSLSPFTKKDDTKEIIINALPLPLKQKGDVITADGFLDDNSKMQLVLFDGLQGGENICLDPSGLLMPTIYEDEYRDWIDFQLNAVTFRWVFNSYLFSIKDLTLKSTPYAYGRNFVVKKLSKSKIGRDIVQTEIEGLTID